ncbi:YbgC/FadM family acyl-CoA thioesterase [bacterium]|nr:YbgC/FadM family acyl-CoA thioesterase [bacterium]
MRVYYEDTDAGGIVYHGNYFRFAERARTEMLRVMGYNQSELWKEPGIGFVMRRAEIEYFKAIRLDDVITVESHLQALGRTSMTMHQNLRRGADLMASIVVVLVGVDRNFKPIRMPEDIAQALLRIRE